MPVWIIAVSILLLSGLGVTAAAQPVTASAGLIRVPRGTPIRVAFQYGVSSRAAKEGDKVYLRVVEPVLHKEAVIIPADAVVEALVSRVRPPADYGTAGALEIDAEFVRIGDDRIPLQGSIGSEAASSRATANQGAVTVPFGSLRRGKSANIEAGTAFIVYTARDY
jgi:hypothetical protein